MTRGAPDPQFSERSDTDPAASEFFLTE